MCVLLYFRLSYCPGVFVITVHSVDLLSLIIRHLIFRQLQINLFKANILENKKLIKTNLQGKSLPVAMSVKHRFELGSSQLVFTCSKLTMETPEHCVKFVQS